MLMKLTTGVDFINYAQLLHKMTPEKQKNTVKLSVFFALSGSAGEKAALKMLMKLTLARGRQKMRQL